MKRTSSRRPLFESLESRVFLSASVIDIAADNRGLVVITFNEDMNPATFTPSSVRLATAGADKRFGTGDDVFQTIGMSYNPQFRALTLGLELPSDTPYRVILDGSTIRAADNSLLDGEFNGQGVPSGDGTPGGNFDIITSPSVNIARMSTIVGNIDIQLFAERTPLTVANFISYANAGDWDSTFFHRSVTNPVPFVIQGGGFNVDNNNQIGMVPQGPRVVNEPGISNTRGTIAMAKLGGDPNSATNQWFFNLADNSANLDFQNGGFTVFGQIIDDSGLAVMDAIADFPIVNAGAPLDELPVRDLDVVLDRQALDPQADLIFVNRVALLMEVRATQVAEPAYVVGADAGGGPVVRAYDADGREIFSTFVHDPAYRGGVRVALGDINGDGVPDIITGTGIGASHIRVLDGQTGQQIAGPLGSFLAFPGPGSDTANPNSDYYVLSYKGGVHVAAGDVNNDGHDDVIVSVDTNAAPHVKVFSGKDGSLLHSFYAFDTAFRGGVRVAAGDVNGDGNDDIIVGAGAAAPHVKVFDGRNRNLLASFFAYDPGFQGGIFVAAGNVTGDGKAEVITATGVGPPHVKAFNVTNGFAPTTVSSFFAYDQGFLSGVRVAAADVNDDGFDDIITGTGRGAVHLKAFNRQGQLLESFFASRHFTGGMFVG